MTKRYIAVFINFSLLASLLFLAFGIVKAQQQPKDDPKLIDLWQPGDPGQRMFIDGIVLTADGKPIAGADVNIRQADGNGQYHDDRYRVRLTTKEDGRYAFGTVLPGQYYNAKHIHVFVTHPDYGGLETEILFKGDPNIDTVTDRDVAIFLEEARVKGENILYGRFDITMPAGQ